MTRVLVVDDEPQIRRALREPEAHGYEVLAVGTGEEALRRGETADIVFLDLGLPGPRWDRGHQPAPLLL
jgi:CheY-like chemotaxis protein